MAGWCRNCSSTPVSKAGKSAAVPTTATAAAGLLYVSPGLSGALGRSLNAYGFVQLPVYQHYIGYQLAPHYLAAVGLNYGF